MHGSFRFLGVTGVGVNRESSLSLFLLSLWRDLWRGDLDLSLDLLLLGALPDLDLVLGLDGDLALEVDLDLGGDMVLVGNN